MRSGIWLLALCGVFSMAAAPASAASKVGMITFSRLIEKLPAGQVWFTWQDGIFCLKRETRKGDGLTATNPLKRFGPIFTREISSSLNAAPDNPRPNIFEEPSAEDEEVIYEVGGLVHGMDIKVCTLQFGDEDGGAKGSSLIQIEWQVFSRAKREVVATIETSGRFQVGRGAEREDIIGQLMDGAFADSVRQLAASSQFSTLLDAMPPADLVKSTPGRQERIAVMAGRPAPRSIEDAAGATVLVRTSTGHGSGVLVSTDGYVLTDAHVVDLNKGVTIRWSDGFEAPGQVVRLHAKRDVALVKTDPHGRAPLPVRTTRLDVGDAVWAIGAPLDMQLQGTVTRGVVSAHRIIDGFAMIQSDVAVNHGNSGGPLLDDKGFVVGLTEASVQPTENVQVGINYFTPIKDALDFLSLDLVADTTAPPVQKLSTPPPGGSARKR